MALQLRHTVTTILNIFINFYRTNLTATKKHRIVYFTSFCICILILIDANYAPLKTRSDLVVNFECLEARYGRRYGKSNRNYVHVKDHTYDISLRHCLPINDGDTVVIYRSAISNALAFLEINGTNGRYVEDVSFVNGRTGIFLICIDMLMISIFFIFHDKLGNETGKTNMTYFLLLCSIALLLQHVFNIW